MSTVPAVIDFNQTIDAQAEAENENLANIEAAKELIESVLLVCRDQPGQLLSPEFLEAVKTIRQDQMLWAEYRVKIKRAKPSGVLLSDIDEATADQADIGDAGDTVAAELIGLVMESGELLFDTDADKAFASVDINGIFHTLAIGSKAFVDWLSFSYYTSTKKDDRPGKSASEAAIKQAGFALSGIAKHEGAQQRVYLRTADHNGGHYIFIGDDRWRVVEVLPAGWRILDKSPVAFWKPAAMQSLPVPQTGGDLSRLWDFINIPKNERPLVLAWMLEALRTETPNPILALSGPQGSAKSSTHHKIRQLIDNNAVNLRASPKSVEDVFVSAGCNWLVSFENISHLNPHMQDALCTLATGGGYAARTLYTNTDETIIEVKRPVIINSIPNVVTAQDLTDRAISIELERIDYIEESKINAAWDEVKPFIFGALLDLFVKALEQLPKVKLVSPPRMADFTKLGEAMMQAKGHPAGAFDKLYKDNRKESIGRAIESSPVAVAVCEMVEKYTGTGRTVFDGTIKVLLEKLSQYRHDTESWPRSAKGLSDALKRQAPALSTIDISVEFGGRTREGYKVTISKTHQDKNFSHNKERF
jgi:hypothetical protein